MEKIIVAGFGGHAKVVVDSLKTLGRFEIVGYTDVEDKGASIKYLGKDDSLKQIYDSATGSRNLYRRIRPAISRMLSASGSSTASPRKRTL